MFDVYIIETLRNLNIDIVNLCLIYPGINHYITCVRVLRVYLFCKLQDLQSKREFVTLFWRNDRVVCYRIGLILQYQYLDKHYVKQYV